MSLKMSPLWFATRDALLRYQHVQARLAWIADHRSGDRDVLEALRETARESAETADALIKLLHDEQPVFDLDYNTGSHWGIFGVWKPQRWRPSRKRK